MEKIFLKTHMDNLNNPRLVGSYKFQNMGKDLHFIHFQIINFRTG